jgi:hypothetical protein
MEIMLKLESKLNYICICLIFIMLYMPSLTHANENRDEHYLIKLGGSAIPADNYWSNYWHDGITAELGYKIPTPLYRHYNQIWLKTYGSLFRYKDDARFPMESLADTFSTIVDVNDKMTISLGFEHRILFRNDKNNGIPYFNWQLGLFRQTDTMYKSQLPLVGDRNINYKIKGFIGFGLGFELRVRNNIHCLFDMGWYSGLTMPLSGYYYPFVFGVMF